MPLTDPKIDDCDRGGGGGGTRHIPLILNYAIPAIKRKSAGPFIKSASFNGNPGAHYSIAVYGLVFLSLFYIPANQFSSPAIISAQGVFDILTAFSAILELNVPIIP